MMNVTSWSRIACYIWYILYWYILRIPLYGRTLYLSTLWKTLGGQRQQPITLLCVKKSHVPQMVQYWPAMKLYWYRPVFMLNCLASWLLGLINYRNVVLWLKSTSAMNSGLKWNWIVWRYTTILTSYQLFYGATRNAYFHLKATTQV